MDGFHAFVMELFAPMGPVRIRKMFGGAGVYAADVMFALLADEEIYVKADAPLRAELEDLGGEPFRWTNPKTGVTAEMQYVRLPSSAMDDAEEASDWGRRALDVARKAKAGKPKRKKPK